MNISKNTIFLVVLSLFSSFAFAKSQVVQSDIFYEIKKGNVRAVKTWLKANPDLSIQDDQGQSLLMVAVINKKSSIIKLLIKAGVDLNYIDQAGKTALDRAVEQQHHSIAITLFQKGATVTSIHNLQILKKWQINRGLWFTAGFVIGLIAVGFCVPGMSAVVVSSLVLVSCASAGSYSTMIVGSLIGIAAVLGTVALIGYTFKLPGKAQRNFACAIKAEELITSATIQV